MQKKYSDKDYNQLKYYYNLLSEKRAVYFQSFDNYYNYLLFVSDKYNEENLEKLAKSNYVEWEKLKTLFMNMVIARAGYESALRDLFNFKQYVRMEYGKNDIGMIFDRRSYYVA